jgi:fluoroacetyl-CoA thioesterase
MTMTSDGTGPSIGLRHTATMTVEPRHTVPAVEPSWPGFADMPPVFATAMMIGFVEQTCVEALRPWIGAGQHSVGIHVNVSHVAATPVGLEVAAEVELIEINDRVLTFRATCCDSAGLIGEGVHRRAVIDLSRFLAKMDLKAKAHASPG